MKTTRKVALLTLLALLILLISSSSKKPTQEGPLGTEKPKTTKVNNWAGLKKEVDAYHALHNAKKDQFFLFKPLLADQASTADQVKSFRARINALKERHAEASTLSREISLHFQEFKLGIFWDGHAYFADEFKNPIEGSSRVQKLVLVPKEMVEHPTLERTNFLYKTETKIIIISSLEWPDAILASRMYHELGHAYRNQVEASSINEAASDRVLAAEAEMHTLEGQVLNHVTGGRFNKWLDGVIDRVKKEKEFGLWRDHVFQSIKLEDMTAADEVLGTQSAGKMVIKSQVAAMFLQIGFRMVERVNDTPGTILQAKIDHCKWFKSLVPKLGGSLH